MGGSEDGRTRAQALPGRPNRFEVDLGAIAHNAATIRRLVGPSCKIFAALKADAYGYGIAAVAPAVAAAGVDGISLVSVADAVSLRQRGVEAHIHVRDNVPMAYLDWQFGRFTAVLEQLEAAGIHIPVRMTASTAVLEAASTRMNLNAIDPGRVWFGLDRGGPGLEKLDLRPAFVALKTAVVQGK